MALIGIRYDLRVPAFSSTTHAEAYRACLEQCEWADRLGLELVVLSEHHGVEDGYLPAPLTLAAAIAGRTRQIRLQIAALLVPLHDPVRLAEQLAVLDLASGSRVGFIAGLGYRQEEFDMAGIERGQRAKLFEEAIGVLRQAWTGEPFEWRGRTIRVTPRPANPPMILVGGSTPVAARRAARLRCGFWPSIGDPALAGVYLAECQKHGFAEGFVSLPSGPAFVHVSRDPEKDWQVIGRHALHDAQSYSSWQTPDQRSLVHVRATTLEELRASGVYRVLTPEQCVKHAHEGGHVILHPLMGGMPPDLGWEGLRLFESEVLPAIR
jgi:alkanesulfonate monooxygenase SsuD/methylene tetrahydromethanopterin reductase-like flavin-dependent oxidoreductase (luciferase family)